MSLGVISGFIVLIVALISLLFSRQSAKEDAKVLDLTNKIDQNKKAAAVKQTDADKKTQEYLDALKKYDPNFHDDNGDGKPSA